MQLGGMQLTPKHTALELSVTNTTAHRQEQHCRATPVHGLGTVSRGVLGMIKACFLFVIGAVLLQASGQLTAPVPTHSKDMQTEWCVHLFICPMFQPD